MTMRTIRSVLTDSVGADVPVAQFGVQGYFENAIENILTDAVNGIEDLLVAILDQIQSLLLFGPPGEDTSTGLDAMFLEVSLPAFFVVLSLGWLATLVSIQVYPSAKSDPYRLLERSFAAVVVVVIGREAVDAAVEFTTLLGEYFFPGLSTFTDAFGGDPIAVAASGIVGIVIALLAGSSILLAAVVFFVMLALRVFVVYAFYGLLPLVMAFWIFDMGIGKYGKKVSDIFVKSTAMILVSGVFIAAVFRVGTVIASLNVVSDSFIISNMMPLIGLGGAMTVSTTLVLLGLSSLTGGSAGSALAGGIAGAVAGRASSGGGSGGGLLGSGGDAGESGQSEGATGADEGLGGGATTSEFEPTQSENTYSGVATDGSGAATASAGAGTLSSGGGAPQGGKLDKVAPGPPPEQMSKRQKLEQAGGDAVEAVKEGKSGVIGAAAVGFGTGGPVGAAIGVGTEVAKIGAGAAGSSLYDNDFGGAKTKLDTAGGKAMDLGSDVLNKVPDVGLGGSGTKSQSADATSTTATSKNDGLV